MWEPKGLRHVAVGRTSGDAGRRLKTKLQQIIFSGRKGFHEQITERKNGRKPTRLRTKTQKN